MNGQSNSAEQAECQRLPEMLVHLLLYCSSKTWQMASLMTVLLPGLFISVCGAADLHGPGYLHQHHGEPADDAVCCCRHQYHDRRQHLRQQLRTAARRRGIRHHWRTQGKQHLLTWTLSIVVGN